MVAATQSSDTPTGAAPWLLAVSLGVLLLPSYVDVYRAFWQFERGAQAPVILAIVAWLIWRERAHLPRAQAAAPMAGIAAFAAGLLLYVIARSQSIYFLEIGAQIPILLGLVRMLWGAQGLRRLWFPIVLLAFVVPIPGSLLDALLLPLKDWVSASVDALLHACGYPIARDGVLLLIGPYRLLIADACSGLNSMVALAGVGLLYVRLAGHRGVARNALLIASILPIAFAANVLRVLALVLITFYRGEEAGHAFHEHAGFIEVLLAFGAFFALDALLGIGRRPRPPATRLTPAMGAAR